MNKANISFNDEWVRSITKGEFMSYCEMHHSEFAKRDAGAYYDSVVPAQKRKKNEPKRNEEAPGGAAM